jgi:hypothetical protein
LVNKTQRILEINPHQSRSNPRPPPSEGSALNPSYPPNAKPQAPQACMHMKFSKTLIYHSAGFDTMEMGSKIKILS